MMMSISGADSPVRTAHKRGFTAAVMLLAGRAYHGDSTIHYTPTQLADNPQLLKDVEEVEWTTDAGYELERPRPGVCPYCGDKV